MLNSSLISSISEQDEDKQLQDLKRKQELNIIKNNFTLLIILNILNFMLFLFSFCFYMWYQLEMELTQISDQKKQQQRIWLNMLYVFDQDSHDGNHYLTFDEYKQSQYFICNFYEDHEFCEKKFNQMKIVGYICFIVIMVGLFLQAIDLYRLLKLRADHDNRSVIKAYWIQPFIILTYMAGFFTYFFAVLYIQIANKELSFDLGSFGISFWVGLSSIPIYCILTVYYRKTKKKLKSSELVENLMQKINGFQESQNQKDKKLNETREEPSISWYNYKP